MLYVLSLVYVTCDNKFARLFFIEERRSNVLQGHPLIIVAGLSLVNYGTTHQ